MLFSREKKNDTHTHTLMANEACDTAVCQRMREKTRLETPQGSAVRAQQQLPAGEACTVQSHWPPPDRAKQGRLRCQRQSPLP